MEQRGRATSLRVAACPVPSTGGAQPTRVDAFASLALCWRARDIMVRTELVSLGTGGPGLPPTPCARVDVNALCSVYAFTSAERHPHGTGCCATRRISRVVDSYPAPTTYGPKRHQTGTNASSSQSRLRPPFTRRPTPEARSPRADRGRSRSTRDPRCGLTDAIAPPTSRSSASGATQACSYAFSH